jgi:hypothetical protein
VQKWRRRRKQRGKKKYLSVESTDPIAEFQMKERETWKKIQGKCINFHVEPGTNIMCPRFHMKGVYHKKYNFATTHLQAKDIQVDVRVKYCGYLKQIWQLE